MLWILAAVLLLVTVLTWGSLGSVATGFGLILLASSWLYQRFLTNHDPGDYQME